MTADRTNDVLNNRPPNIEPNGINAVLEDELLPAKIAVKTSGEPFANAKNVIPAKVGDISIKLLILISVLNLVITFYTHGVNEF